MNRLNPPLLPETSAELLIFVNNWMRVVSGGDGYTTSTFFSFPASFEAEQATMKTATMITKTLLNDIRPG
jgi:hypothetical protein